jgi:pre-mRNA-splicing factor ATP-dependent RNA helicase DHX38/PRP16
LNVGRPRTAKSSAQGSEHVFRFGWQQALAIHLSHPPGDILIFMTGQEDIETTCELIAERIMDLGADKVPPLLLIPLFSNLSSDQQAKVGKGSATNGSRE